MKMLVVTNNQILSKTVCDDLIAENYGCDCPRDIESAKSKSVEGDFDCLLVDTSEQNALDLLQNCKKNVPHTAVISLTVKENLDQKLLAITLGADEDVSIPIFFPDLHRKIEFVIKTAKANQKRYLFFANASIDLNANCAFIDDKQVNLSKSELAILTVFLKNPNQLICLESLKEHSGSDAKAKVNQTDNVSQTIRTLRKKLVLSGVFYGPDNIYKKGYIWNNLKKAKPKITT